MNDFTEFHLFLYHLGFPGGASHKESTSKSGDIEDIGLTPRSGRSWRRAWQATPVFLPREYQGQKNLEGYSLRGGKESDITEAT